MLVDFLREQVDGQMDGHMSRYVWNYFQFLEWLQRQTPADLPTPHAAVLACLKVPIRGDEICFY